MNPKKKKPESALGKGLDALIRKNETKTVEDNIKENSKKIENIETADKDLENKLVLDVLDEVKKNPRISLWSARSAAVLRFLKKTKPEFSISSEASILIEEAVKEKYPDIWKIFHDL
ncbi:MAG: hypothetical protein QME14_02670 [Methanobacteriaceae archaeon]|nr:hypothetical protein [Methanobacteriaceae archaeon]